MTVGLAAGFAQAQPQVSPPAATTPGTSTRQPPPPAPQQQQSGPQTTGLTVDAKFVSNEVKIWLMDYVSRVFPILTGLVTGLVLIIFGGVGWIGKWWMERLVAEEISQATAKMQREMRARFYTARATLLWQQDPRRHLESVIGFTEDAFRLLQPGDGHLWDTKNNLAYYYAERGDTRNADDCVSLAKELRKQSSQDNDYDYMTTYARVLTSYHPHFPDPKRAVREAKKMMEELQNDSRCPEYHKSNANRHAKALEEVLKGL
jgi:hypothetical protein